MKDITFFNNFFFNEFSYTRLGHRDNSHGIENHFIGYMKSGNAKIISENIKLELKKGDMFYIPKGLKYHSYWKTGEETVVFDSIGFKFFPTNDLSEYLLQKIEYDEEIMEIFLPLSQNKRVDCASIGILYTLLGALENRLVRAENKGGSETIGRLIALMKNNSDKTAAEYAEELGISESSLYNYVKRNLGKTPNTLKQEIVCQKAVEMLRTTSFSVEEICDKCGFSSASYFRKIMRKTTGKTPTQIRKEEKAV